MESCNARLVQACQKGVLPVMHMVKKIEIEIRIKLVHNLTVCKYLNCHLEMSTGVSCETRVQHVNKELFPCFHDTSMFEKKFLNEGNYLNVQG